jgi:predicted extracellular nuclease
LPEYYAAWWNLENLFDTENAQRSDKLKRTIQNELKGWNEAILDCKISQLSKIILKMNDGDGPDILGVCEVENKAVLEKLVDKINQPQKKYNIAHDDTKDKRGIDVAFIYDSSKFSLKRQFSHWIVKRNATRDIFQINLKIKNSDVQIVCIGNHWPARIGGVSESEPYRIIAAEALSYFHQRVKEEMGDNTPILVMGDFNDQPFSRSVMNYALSTNISKKLKRARSPKLFNLMWSLLAQGDATHYYGDGEILDQFMVSKGFLFNKSKLSIKKDSVKIEKFSEMSKRGKPQRFGRPSKKYNKNGFSDHYPISLVMLEK